MQTVFFQSSSDTMLMFEQVNVLLHLTLIISLKDKQSHKTQQFILGNPHGEENPIELRYNRFNQVECQDGDLYHQEEWCTNRERSSAKNTPTNKPYIDLSHKCTLTKQKGVLGLCETPQDEMCKMTRLYSYLYLTLTTWQGQNGLHNVILKYYSFIRVESTIYN